MGIVELDEGEDRMINSLKDFFFLIVISVIEALLNILLN